VAVNAGDPTEYLNHYVFPVLLPAMERMLEQAKKEKCFEVKGIETELFIGIIVLLSFVIDFNIS